MTFLQTVKHLRENPKDAFYYWQGTIRLFIYLRWPFLIRKHIREQYKMRRLAAWACTKAGACLCCSCETPSLYMANKPCSISKFPACKSLVNKKDPCYPKMLGRKAWNQQKLKTS